MKEKIRVLYVDDESTLLDLCKTYLERSGDFIITILPSAPEAIRMLELVRFDAIISDYQMPEMNGIEFLKVVRARGDKTPFIIFTGKGREEVVIEALNSGADFYIQKGGEPKSQFVELAHKIRRAVQHRTDEKALTESEERFRALVENTSDIIRILDREGRIIFDTAASGRELGYPPGYTIGKYPSEFIHPDDLAVVKQELSMVYAKTNTGVPTEFRVRKADGSYVWAESVGKNLIGVSGVDGVVITTRFIDERKRAEEVLRESEARLSLALEVGNAGIWEWNLETNEVHFDTRFHALLGYNPGELPTTAEEWKTYHHPGDLPVMLSTAEAYLRGDSPVYESEHRIRTKAGEWAWIFTRGRLMSRTTKGSLKLFMGFAMNITDRKRAEESLKKSQGQLAEAMDLAHLVNWEFDVASGIFTFNDPFYALYGTTAEREGGYQMPAEVYAREFVYPDDAGMVANEVQNAINATDPNYTRQIEHRIIRRDGEIRHIIVRFGITKDTFGRTVITHGANQDITDRKQTELEIQQLLANVSQEKDRLSSLINSISDEVWFADTEGRFTLANPSALREFRLDHADGFNVETLAKSLEVLRPDGSPRPVDEAPPLRALAGEVVRLQEEIVRTPATGELRYRQVSAAPVHNDKGIIMGSISVVRDITERKKAEQSLQESALRWQSTFDSTQDAIFILDAEQRIITCNRMMLEILGVKNTDDLIGRHCWEVVHKTTEPIPGCPLVRMRQSRTREQMELKIGERWFVVTADPILDETRTLIGAVHNIRDITERKRAEEAVQESEKKFATVFRSSPVALTLVSTRDGTFVDVNDTFVRNTGYPRDEVIGTTSEALGIFADRDEYEQMVTHLRDQQCIYGMEMKFRIKTEEIRTCLVSSRFILVSGKPHILSTIEDITARKNAEEALRQSESRFRALAENASDIIRILDPEGRIVFDSAAAERLLGYPPGFTIGRSPYEFIHPDDLGMVKQNLSEVYNNNNPGLPTEFRIRKADGSYTWVESFGKNLIGVPGVNGVVITTRFIDDRKKAEEALRESEERYRALVDNALEAILIFDFSGTALFANHATAALFEVDDPSALTGRNVMEFIAPESRETVLAGFASVMEGRDAYLAQYKVITATRREKWVEAIGKKIQFSGAPADIVTLRDITERKLAEDVLKKSEEQYRSLLEHVPELILVHRNGIILYTNPAAVKSLGYQPYEALHRQVNDFIAPEFHDRVAAAVRRRMSGETVEPYEIDVISRDGSRRTMVINGTQIEFEGVPASLIVLVDITEQKALHDSVTLANKKLNLLSSITRHDIINQLSALNGYLELSRDLLNDPVKLAEFITKEQNIAGTIDDQIRFTKDYQDLGIHAPVWQNVHESVVMARESLPLRGIAVETNSPALEVYADPLLVRVFYNLIDNALRYGSDQMTAIRISSQVSSRGLMIVCEDDGVGIPADKKVAIFNRGYFKHTGFGLFLCREILSITGITITENGVPGKGARFEITVPEGAYRFTNTGEK